MNNTYLITGATSEVGQDLLLRLLKKDEEGLFVVQGCGDLEKLAPLCTQFKGRLRTFDVDLSKQEAVERFLLSLDMLQIEVSHIVHLPALRAVNTKFKNFDEERFALDWQVQINSILAISKRYLPKMAKQKRGRVLFMLTSYVLGAPPKFMAAYVMAKEAMHGLAKSLAVEYAKSGICVNCVAPSMMETNFLADTPDLVVQASAEANPMGRNARVQDVTPAMEFLLSEEAGFITGVVLPITGGSAIL